MIRSVVSTMSASSRLEARSIAAFVANVKSSSAEIKLSCSESNAWPAVASIIFGLFLQAFVRIDDFTVMCSRSLDSSRRPPCRSGERERVQSSILPIRRTRGQSRLAHWRTAPAGGCHTRVRMHAPGLIVRTTTIGTGAGLGGCDSPLDARRTTIGELPILCDLTRHLDAGRVSRSHEGPRPAWPPGSFAATRSPTAGVSRSRAHGSQS